MDDSLNAQSPQDGEAKPNTFLDGEKLTKMFKAYGSAKEEEISLARRCWDFYHGYQWSSEEQEILRKRQQPDTYYNQIRLKVNAFVGLQENMRRDPKAFARTPKPNSQKLAEGATKILRFITDNNNFANIEARVTLRGIVGGYDGIEFDIEPDGDQSEIVISPISKNTFFYDPRSEEQDFSDAKSMGTAKWVDIEDVKALFPHKTDFIDEIVSAAETNDYSSFEKEQDKKDTWVEFGKKRMWIVEHWYLNKGQWHCAHHCGIYVINEQISPFVDDKGKTMHRYELWTPLMDEAGMRYGAVKDMIPIQSAINKRHSSALHNMSKKTIVYEEGSVEDIQEARRQLHKADGVVEVNPGGMRFEIISNDSEASGQLSLLQHDLAQMNEMGPNNALTGRGTESQSGIAIQEQKHSGVTEQSPQLQELRNWKIRGYRKMWNLARQFWTTERYIRVAEDGGTAQFLGLNQIGIDEQTGKFAVQNKVEDMDVEIILDEGPDTVTVQQEDFRTLLEVAPFLKQNGQPLPPEVIFEATPLSSKDKIMQKLQESEAKTQQMQQHQMQQEQRKQSLLEQEFQLKLAEIQAGIQETVSKTGLNNAKALKEAQAADVLDEQDRVDLIPLDPYQGRDQGIVYPDQIPQEFVQ